MIAAKTMQPDHKNNDLVQSARQVGERENCKLSIRKEDFGGAMVRGKKEGSQLRQRSRLSQG